jgi:hypothetical protein
MYLLVYSSFVFQLKSENVFKDTHIVRARGKTVKRQINLKLQFGIVKARPCEPPPHKLSF